MPEEFIHKIEESAFYYFKQPQANKEKYVYDKHIRVDKYMCFCTSMFQGLLTCACMSAYLHSIYTYIQCICVLCCVLCMCVLTSGICVLCCVVYMCVLTSGILNVHASVPGIHQNRMHGGKVLELCTGGISVHVI